MNSSTISGPDQVILSGFADEAAEKKTIDQQFAALAAIGLKYFSIRFLDAGGGIKNVMDLSAAEVETVTSAMAEYQLSVSSLGSPLGKTKLLDVEDGTGNVFVPFEAYLQNQVRRACDLATRFGTKLVRGFSFYQPKGQPAQPYVAQVVERLGRIADVCDSFGLSYGVEVEANLVGHNGPILSEIHRQIASPALLLVFDGANLVTQGMTAEEVFAHYQLMKPGLGWLHIKDHRAHPARGGYVDEQVLVNFVPPDRGASDHRRILADLKSFLPELQQRMAARQVPGVFLDLEPHLKGGGQFGGFSGPDGFGLALRSLCGLLDEAQIGYRLRDLQDVQAGSGHPRKLQG